MELVIETLTALDTFRALVACLFASGCLLFVGLKVRSLRRKAWSNAKSVMLKVVALHADEPNSYGSIEYRAEYEVLNGPHAGQRRRSEITAHPAIHTAGDTAAGLFNPVSGALETNKSLKRVAIMETVMFGASTAIMAFGIAYTIS